MMRKLLMEIEPVFRLFLNTSTKDAIDTMRIDFAHCIAMHGEVSYGMDEDWTPTTMSAVMSLTVGWEFANDLVYAGHFSTEVSLLKKEVNLLALTIKQKHGYVIYNQVLSVIDSLHFNVKKASLKQIHVGWIAIVLTPLLREAYPGSAGGNETDRKAIIRTFSLYVLLHFWCAAILTDKDSETKKFRKQLYFELENVAPVLDECAALSPLGNYYGLPPDSEAISTVSEQLKHTSLSHDNLARAIVKNVAQYTREDQKDLPADFQKFKGVAALQSSANEPSAPVEAYLQEVYETGYAGGGLRMDHVESFKRESNLEGEVRHVIIGGVDVLIYVFKELQSVDNFARMANLYGKPANATAVQMLLFSTNMDINSIVCSLMFDERDLIRQVVLIIASKAAEMLAIKSGVAIMTSKLVGTVLVWLREVADFECVKRSGVLGGKSLEILMKSLKKETLFRLQ